MVHVVQPQNVLVSKWTSLGVTTHLREGFLLKLMDLATCAAAEQLSGLASQLEQVAFPPPLSSTPTLYLP